MLNWIDKEIKKVDNDELFQLWFNGIGPTKDGETYYLSNLDKGIELVLSDKLSITSIHLFSSRNPKGKEFKHGLPFDIKFSMSRSSIWELLGEPNKKGGGYTDMFGTVPSWDKYFFDNYSLHLQYSSDNGYVDLITIGSLSLESYFNIGLQ